MLALSVKFEQVRITLTFISIFLLLNLFAQGVFKGQFRSLTNGEPILYAKVKASSGETRLSNIYGYVEIPYNAKDKIVITHLTYDTLVIKPEYFKQNDTTIFYLKPRIYTLKEFKFSILGPRATFDQRFVQNDLGQSDEEKVKERLKIIGMKQELISLDKAAQSGMVLGSPISFLYDKYSKSGKEKSKYRMLVERDRRYAQANKKFDDLIVKTLTNYSDKTLEEFIEFCSFHPTYVDQVDALQLYYEILHCRDEFVIQKETPENRVD